ncbi:FAD-dependent monooxygenase [Streptomonospora nanhaiensis]|uniref:2-polyprenyl-6-methoxyphenol hydroxylase-like FAD-dependent oxidoreductase n=1 Tax=Streptomonospora nanhaiensis TaxID=1323731 RepID=A0A853BL66_9ACTN|nr:FAD-dependent monooxygenase [Streptomonospora nanhaiensis]MBV2366684.1 FAD-dependent monooxygenase [Streptomonospora nanhaiensis]MBX9391408.1 FAD-dependent monooxygenase [Streptomonospora nanhaiensis]NYI95973.1 2-polyprenyl-6-methoxyphenol hydroxylase-like FAD-dependent oxidoreductase [Streptomonospora nanhaiensis]
MGLTVLISGASVAGPVLAYWLRRRGHNPVVVERTPELRMGTGGHAVDLFEPAVEIAERMGVLDEVRAAATGTARLTLERPGRRPVEVDLGGLAAESADRHVEVLRGELARILHAATRDDVEYVFGDSISALREDPGGVEVAFEHAAPRRFDLVVGADGLHSQVRRLVFGPEERHRHFLGGYLSAFTVPNHLGLSGRMVVYNAVDRLVGLYPVWQTGDARAVFLRRHAEVPFDHRDTEAQLRLLREMFADDGWQVPRLLEEAGGAADFYFDSISQIRMAEWWRGRTALVGDAGYAPGPAVGGGTTVAFVAAYVLAGHLAAAEGDHRAAFAGYTAEIGDYVARSRGFGPRAMRTLVPRSPLEVRLAGWMLSALPRLPAAVSARLLGGENRVSTQLARFPVREYPVAPPAGP